jgi:N6-adenosine-specific RNA methylase IME4
MNTSEHERYGALKEGVHLAGYSFERACSHLEWLLEDNRWGGVGGGFDDVNKFLDSIRFDKFRQTIEQRKRIAAKIKKLQPKASMRQIARTLGADEETIRNDLAENSAPALGKPKGLNAADAENSAPPLSGTAAARMVARRETGKLARIAKVTADEERVLNLVPVQGKFRTLVIDPAWDYDWLSLAGRARPGYAMQSIESLRELDVRAWADEDEGCHLYCWTTNNFSNEAHKLVEHWGFQHRTVLTWIKPPPFGLGSYYRNSTEQVLFATLGETTTRHAAASIPTHFEAPRGEHSEKPEKFYEIVRAASYPPYGEANQREGRPDFVNLFELRESDEAAE